MNYNYICFVRFCQTILYITSLSLCHSSPKKIRKIIIQFQFGRLTAMFRAILGPITIQYEFSLRMSRCSQIHAGIPNSHHINQVCSKTVNVPFTYKELEFKVIGDNGFELRPMLLHCNVQLYLSEQILVNKESLNLKIIRTHLKKITCYILYFAMVELYIVGEAYSDQHGWIEGALNTSQSVLSKYYDITFNTVNMFSQTKR